MAHQTSALLFHLAASPKTIFFSLLLSSFCWKQAEPSGALQRQQAHMKKLELEKIYFQKKSSVKFSSHADWISWYYQEVVNENTLLVSATYFNQNIYYYFSNIWVPTCLVFSSSFRMSQNCYNLVTWWLQISILINIGVENTSWTILGYWKY